jgi:hypothetical protein
MKLSASKYITIPASISLNYWFLIFIFFGTTKESEKED